MTADLSLKSPSAAFDQVANDLIGMKLGHIWRGHGTALFLEFGTLSGRIRKDGSVGNPLGQISVGLEFEWRIEAHRRIICGSHGDQALWDATFRELLGKRVTKVELFGDVPEVCVTLDGRDRVMTFSLDEAGPEWALTDNRPTPAVWVYWSDGDLRSDAGAASAS